MTDVRHTSAAARLVDKLRLFGTERRGMAAVEFALILPVMVLMYFGVVELTTGFTANRKLVLLTRSLADLTSQASTSITNGTATDSNDLTTIFGAATSTFYPFTNAGMSIASVRFVTASDGVVRAFTVWSVASNGGLPVRACGELAQGNTAPAVPAGLFVDGSSVVIADTNYNYLPLAGPTFRGISSNGEAVGTSTAFPMQQSSYMQPRSQPYISANPVSNICPKPSKWPTSGPTWQ